MFEWLDEVIDYYFIDLAREHEFSTGLQQTDMETVVLYITGKLFDASVEDEKTYTQYYRRLQKIIKDVISSKSFVDRCNIHAVIDSITMIKTPTFIASYQMRLTVVFKGVSRE